MNAHRWTVVLFAVFAVLWSIAPAAGAATADRSPPDFLLTGANLTTTPSVPLTDGGPTVDGGSTTTPVAGSTPTDDGSIDPTATATPPPDDPLAGPTNGTDETVQTVTESIGNETGELENGTTSVVEDVDGTLENATNGSGSVSANVSVGLDGSVDANVSGTAGTSIEVGGTATATTESGGSSTGQVATTARSSETERSAAAASGDDGETPGRRGGGLPNAAGGVAVLGLGTLAASALLHHSTAISDLLSGGGSSLLRRPSVLWRRPAFDAPGWLTRVFGTLGYSRYDDSDPLEHEARKRLYERIEAAPGVYLSGLAETEDLPISTARHHLRILEAEGLVTTTMIRGRRRYVPARTEDPELEAALEDDVQAAILARIAGHDRVSVSSLAEELDRDTSTVSYHLTRLSDAGLVERERDGRIVWNRVAPHVAPYFEGASVRAESD